jgi:hypothetical protein
MPRMVCHMPAVDVSVATWPRTSLVTELSRKLSSCWLCAYHTTEMGLSLLFVVLSGGSVRMVALGFEVVPSRKPERRAPRTAAGT